MNIVKLLPVSFLHGQISCLIECLICLVAVHANKKNSCSCTEPFMLHIPQHFTRYAHLISIMKEIN